ncbi:MAG TPA: prepilin-type N-terminal cleavage/methylation domain-containing protein, partial [Aquifex aeolicus]|nr:prepilin-type N-terminal cleavage/methylation domain-containing protein [Aquifex aeolicus]
MERSRGLTLIELAVVLVVLGILVGIGAGIVGVLIKRVKYSESKEKVKANVEAIIGYATASGKLPGNSTEIQSAIKSFKDSYGKPMMYVFAGELSTGTDPICARTSTDLSINVGCKDPACSSYDQYIENVAFLIISGDGNYNLQTVDSGKLGNTLTRVDNMTGIIALKVNGTHTVNIYEYGVNIDDWKDNSTDINRPEPY